MTTHGNRQPVVKIWISGPLKMSTECRIVDTDTDNEDGTLGWWLELLYHESKNEQTASKEATQAPIRCIVSRSNMKTYNSQVTQSHAKIHTSGAKWHPNCRPGPHQCGLPALIGGMWRGYNKCCRTYSFNMYLKKRRQGANRVFFSNTHWDCRFGSKNRKKGSYAIIYVSVYIYACWES